MGGEKSLSLGEAGEERVKAFLQRIRWNGALHHVEIKCCHNDKHMKDGSDGRKTHGEDFLWSAPNPFYPEQLDVVHIQVKNPGKYKSSANNIREVKKWAKELSNTIECSSKNREVCEYVARTKNSRSIFSKTVDYGVLFFLSNDPGESEKGILDGLLTMEYPLPSEVRPIYIIDNKRLAFLNKIVDFIDRERKDLFSSYSYYTPHYGEVTSDQGLMDIEPMPLSYMCGGMVAVKMKHAPTKKQGLYLFCPECYSEKAASMCAGLGFALLGRWGDFLRLVFPKYEPGKGDTLNAEEKLRHEFASAPADFELSIHSL